MVGFCRGRGRPPAEDKDWYDWMQSLTRPTPERFLFHHRTTGEGKQRDYLGFGLFIGQCLYGVTSRYMMLYRVTYAFSFIYSFKLNY